MPFANRVQIRVLICVFALIVFVLLSAISADAKGLPKDLGVRMAKIYAGECGQAGGEKKDKKAVRSGKPKIKMDSATLKLSTERIEISELQALIGHTLSPAEPDKTAKISLEHSRIALRTIAPEAAGL